jgi:hypothetical protein
LLCPLRSFRSRFSVLFWPRFPSSSTLSLSENPPLLPSHNQLAMAMGLGPSLPRGKRHLSRCLVAQSESGARGRSLNCSDSFVVSFLLSKLLPWQRRGRSFPFAWQRWSPSPPSFFRDLQMQRRNLTCGGGEKLQLEIPDGCAECPSFRACSPGASPSLLEARVTKLTVEDELLVVRHRHRSWPGKLSPPCLSSRVSRDPGGQPKTPDLSSRLFL